jgi:hypothetical protein
MIAHDVVLRGLGGDTKPLIIERIDNDLIGSTMRACTTPNPLPALAAWRPATDASVNALRIYQPVHRSFALTMMEAACERFGEPALDPDKIESAGIVVRRVARSNPKKRKKNDGQPDTIRVNEAWVESEGTLRGWQPFVHTDDADLDPDPARRTQPFHAGQPEMKRLLSALLPPAKPLSEDTADLFVAPPEVCEASRRSILYGMLPVTSFDRSEAGPNLSAMADTDEMPALVDRILPDYLKARGEWLIASSIAGVTFVMAYLPSYPDLQKYADFLRVMFVQFDLLGDSAESKALLRAISDVKVYFSKDPKAPAFSASDHLTQAIEALIRGSGSVQIPVRWGAVSSTQAATIHKAMEYALAAKTRSMLPADGRFDDPKALYQARAFMRVLRDDGCPPLLVWSDPSPDFEIVPWYENSKVPPIAIQLPELTLENLKKLKPNVSFKLPSALFNFLNNTDPKKILDKSAGDQAGDGIDWICSFNLPIITLCAFIILYIFLTLLDIVFFWMAFIKICIPIPKRGA